MKIGYLRTNHLVNPIGYDINPISLSWITDNTTARRQKFAQVKIKRVDLNGDMELVLDSGKREDISSLDFESDIKLYPYTRYEWQVTVWGDNGESATSEKAFFETGKLKDIWLARWISPPKDSDLGADLNLEDNENLQLHPYMRKDIIISGKIKRARIYSYALGLYELEINGKKVGDEYLLPGFHSYDFINEYQTFDVTNMLKNGKNAIGALLGPGWYKGRFGFEGGFINLYGDRLAFLCELRVDLEDGSNLVFVSDNTWKYHESPVISSGIYDGEIYDSNKEINGWCQLEDNSDSNCAANIDSWNNVEELSIDFNKLVERTNPPIHIIRRTNPVKLLKVYESEPVISPDESNPECTDMSKESENIASTSEINLDGIDASKESENIAIDNTENNNLNESISDNIENNKRISEYILDVGQEVTGWVEFMVNVPAGTHVKLSYGEILQNGKFYRDNLRFAKAEYEYISDGNPRKIRPHFTFYGFRYIKVEGLSEEALNLENFEVCVIMSDIPHIGSIETSNHKINQLFSNALWSQRDNFLDIPTDCPQRDERLGWTGDAAVFASTAAENMYTPAFYNNFMKNIRLEQIAANGAVPLFVPVLKETATSKSLGYGNNNDLFKKNTNGFSVWGDVGTILPFTVYQMYGDKSLLRKHYPIMRDWVEYIMRQDKENGDKGLWKSGDHLGDWLALDHEDIQNPMGATDVYYIATAFYYNSTNLTAKASKILGYNEEAKAYEKQADKIKNAFLEEYFNENGELKIHPTQTAYVVSLFFDLYKDEWKDYLINELKNQIADNNMHLNTGFVGTPLLCRVLSGFGANDYAYTLLLNEDFPSWLYEVNLGATTVWERWNSVLPDGSISGTGMNSLNHYAYGSIVDWMYRNMCGLNPDENNAGYKKVTIKPSPDNRIQSVKGKIFTASGQYEVSWKYTTENTVEYHITVPFDCEATLILPDSRQMMLEAGTYDF